MTITVPWLCYLEALRIKERVLGKTHLLTLETRSSLGALYVTHGDYDKAEPLLEEALKVAKAIYGAASVEYTTALCNLAALYQAKEDDSRAEGLYREALAIRKKALGVKHPGYAAS